MLLQKLSILIYKSYIKNVDTKVIKVLNINPVKNFFNSKLLDLFHLHQEEMHFEQWNMILCQYS